MTKSCEKCQGNGEIVTDWERYKHPHPGDAGDEAVADCPDCDGTGEITESHGVEVWMCTTIYVDADSEEAAEAIVAKQAGTRDKSEGLELAARDIKLYEFADGAVMSPPVSLYGLASESKLVPEADPVRDAAPDMLKVLRRFASVFGENLDDPDEPLNGGDAVDELCKLWPSIKEAIAKAEGGAA
ncbi:hypothetical protein [Hoeflea sp.]|uniref:hypothetical protein n=1 Tax=Hoeflea sp. TaxID=1940281 RepID=UPI003B52358F